MLKRKRRKIRLGEILLQISSLTDEQLREVLYFQVQSETPRPIGEILREKGYINEGDVEIALGLQKGYPYISVAQYRLDPDIIKKIPEDLARKFIVIPLDLINDTLTVAVASFSEIVIEKLEESGFKVRIFLCRSKEIEEALRRYLG